MEKGRKGGLINKTWERCKSFGKRNNNNISCPAGLTKKSRSWPRMATGTFAQEDYTEKRENKRGRVAPEGCFTVYVGQEKQRFVVKTEYANHPLFKMLLEEAESEFGYDSQGPLVLPCNVDVFYKVLVEMDHSSAADDDRIHPGCGFTKRNSSSSSAYHLLSPSRMVVINQF